LTLTLSLSATATCDVADKTLISTAGGFALRSWHATLAGHVAGAVAVKVNDRVNVNEP